MYSTEYAKPFEEHCLNSILFFVALSVIVKFNIVLFYYCLILHFTDVVLSVRNFQ